jgi:hypothetical protein
LVRHRGLIDLVLETTDSTAAASFILVLQTAPFLVATPIAGMLADRPERRLMLAGANVARGVVCIGLLLATDADTVWIAFAVVALLAFGAAFFEPTVSDSLPKFVEREDLPTANALIRSAWGTMVTFGAAIGGLVAATVGREVTFLMYPLLWGISLSFVVYLVGYALLPLSPVIWAAAVFVFVGHVGGGAQWTSSFGLQRATPDRIRGRVLAVDFGLALAISSVSTSIAGWLAGAGAPRAQTARSGPRRVTTARCTRTADLAGAHRLPGEHESEVTDRVRRAGVLGPARPD